MKKTKAEYVFFTMLFIALMGIFAFTSFIILYKLDLAIYYCAGQEDVGIPVDRTNIVNYHSWTKAIYNGEYIQDYFIECENDVLIDMTPLRKPIYVGENWIDPRPIEWQNKWCEK